MMDNGEQENILSVFLEEAAGIVVQLAGQLDELHYGYDGQRILDDIHRGFHTLKGGAAVMGGLEPLVECSSLAEQILDSLRSKRQALNPGLVSLIMRALNSAEAMIEAAAKGQPIEPLPDELRQRLQRASGREGDQEFGELEGAPTAGESGAGGDPLDLFFGDLVSKRGGEHGSGAEVGTMTDDEFEHLLDELHGEGRGPTRSGSAEAAPAAEAEPERVEGAAAGDDPDARRKSMEQIRSLVTELSWVRSRLIRLSALRSKEDLAKALSYLDLVTRDMERWVRETGGDKKH